MTVSAWIKPNSMGQLNLGRIVAKEEGTGAGRWMLIIDGGVNNLSFVKDFSTTELRRRTANNVFSLGVWQHVAATYDGSSSAANVHIYVNGKEVSSYVLNQDGAGAKLSDAAMGVLIGNRGSQDRAFDGSIDDARVYNRALTAAEIQSVMNGN